MLNEHCSLSIGHNGTVVCMLYPKISTSWEKLAPTGRHGRHVFAILFETHTNSFPLAFSSSSIETHVISLSTSSDTGGLPPTGVGHPRWLSSAVVWIAQAPPGRRHPDNPDMDRRHCRSKITALPPCLQVPMPPCCASVEHACTLCTQTNMQPPTSFQSQANMKVLNQVACWPRQLAPHWQRLHGRVRPQQPCPLSQAD